MAERGVYVKLLIDSQSNKVLFAEGGKDLVDFFVHIFSLPLGTQVSLLSKEAMAGCLGNLYSSIEKLSDDYFHSKLLQDSLLKPSSSVVGMTPLVQVAKEAPASSTSTVKNFYSCPQKDHNYVSCPEESVYPECGERFWVPMEYARPEVESQVEPSSCGYVNPEETYIITDDLVVKPASSNSRYIILDKVKVVSLGVRFVQLGLQEAHTHT